VVRRGLARAPGDRFNTAGEFADALAAAFQGVSGKRRLKRPVIIAVALLGTAAAGLVWRSSGSHQHVAPNSASIPKTRLAVLPFTDFGGDSSQKYLADGLTEETISALSNIAGLKVIARTSVMKYRGTAKTVAEIGQELEVGSVLEGSVRTSGDRLRVRVQLVDAKTQESRWGQDYDRKVSDAFAIQNDLASQVARQLGCSRSPQSGRSWGRSPPAMRGRTDAYLRGLFYRNARRGRAARALADSSVKTVSTGDGTRSRFRTGACCTGSSLHLPALSIRSKSPLAARSLCRDREALALDPTLPEAYVARAELSLDPGERLPAEEAIRDLRHAIAFKPNLKKRTVRWVGSIITSGLLDEALRELRIDLDLDPSDLFPMDRIASTHYAQLKLDSALAEYERIPGEYDNRALVLHALGRSEEAFRVIAHPGTDSDKSYRASVLAVLLVSSGRSAEAQHQIHVAERGSGPFPLPPCRLQHCNSLRANGRSRHGGTLASTHGRRRLPRATRIRQRSRSDPLRNDPSFIGFMAELKERWERFRAMV
jgi:TolB-like protein/tetratricopeptide (TPR) repeat protein